MAKEEIEKVEQDDGSVVLNFAEPEKKDDDLSELDLKKEPEKKAPEKVAAKTDEPDPVEALKKQLEESRKREQAAQAEKIEAERKAVEAENQTLEFRSKAEENQYNSIAVALNNSKAVLSSAKVAYAKAMADGDYVVAADEQEKIARATSNITQLEAGKERLEEILKQRKENPPQRKEISDPVEALAATRTPRTAAWIRANGEYVRDQKKFLQLQLADTNAREKGIALDTDEYFDFIEKEVGIKQKEMAQEEKPKGRDVSKQSKPMDAPVTRRSPDGTPQNSKSSVTLSAAEVAAANDMGISLEDYAKSKLQLIKEGAMSAN